MTENSQNFLNLYGRELVDAKDKVSQVCAVLVEKKEGLSKFY